jgi:hypothetical protein
VQIPDIAMTTCKELRRPDRRSPAAEGAKVTHDVDENHGAEVRAKKSWAKRSCAGGTR